MKKKKIFTIKFKLILSLSAIAIMLLASGLISYLEYKRMNDRLSVRISDDIRNINLAQNLEEVCSAYNLQILKVIGDSSVVELPRIDSQSLMEKTGALPASDKVLSAYNAYMTEADELQDVILSDFVDARDWYFNQLQPKYDALNSAIDEMSAEIYEDLSENSETYDAGLNRSVVPMIVAVGGGMLLILMLLFFLLTLYVNPIYKMLDGLRNYRTFNKKYTYDFEGDDQLKELNTGISELIADNQQLRKRVAALRNTINQQQDER